MDYKIIELPRHLDRRGNLSVVENGIHIPFNMKRAFFIYDVRVEKAAQGMRIILCLSL